jgi:dTDP-glucose 4,6-dehydratase
MLSIAEDVVRLMGADRSLITFVGDRPGQVFRHTGDTAKIRAALGWSPRVDWEVGLRQTVDWYRGHRPWWEKQLWMRTVPIITARGTRELH